MVIFNLFSQHAMQEEKQAIGQKLLTIPSAEAAEDENTLVLEEDTKLVDLLDESSWQFFEVTSATTAATERGVALLKEFAGKVGDESQFHSLLQLVESHRAHMSQLTMKALRNL